MGEGEKRDARMEEQEEKRREEKRREGKRGERKGEERRGEKRRGEERRGERMGKEERRVGEMKEAQMEGEAGDVSKRWRGKENEEEEGVRERRRSLWVTHWPCGTCELVT